MLPRRTSLLPLLLVLVSVGCVEAGAQALAAKEAAQALPAEVRWSVAVSVRPAAPPAVGGDRILLPLQSGVVVAYRANDGGEAWRVDLRADQPIAVEGDRVFVASGEAIHALALENAEVLWRAPTGTLTAPLLAQDGWIIAASAAGLAAFRSTDGVKIWQRETGVQTRVRRSRATTSMFRSTTAVSSHSTCAPGRIDGSISSASQSLRRLVRTRPVSPRCSRFPIACSWARPTAPSIV